MGLSEEHMRSRSLSVWLVTVAALLGWAASAQAQVAPRVMIIVDTSGSMLWDTRTDPNRPSTRGDGSVTYPGNDTNGDGLPNDSRLFIAKEAIRDVLINSDANIEFGLMRFHQVEGRNILPPTGGNETGTRYAAAINYSGWEGCDPTNGGADVLVNPGPNSRNQIFSWINNEESFPNEKELRGTGWTPLAQSLDDARFYFAGNILLDSSRTCRSLYVILVTDGVQQCPTSQVAQNPAVAAAALRNIRLGSDTYDVKTFVVGFGAGVNGSDQLNSIARAGGTAINNRGAIDLVAGTALFADNRDQLRVVLEDLLVSIAPQEICDGRDNDCDGQIDEGFAGLGDRCEAGVGACFRQGRRVCSESGTSVICDAQAGPRGVEVCNNIDDDCDGQIDEGTFNACGTCGVTPQEVCDGNDNDCDGQIDEGTFNACGRCGPTPQEVCDGVDNDCDGQFDEGLLNACGDCGPLPEEVCDGADNDCDDQIDEGFDSQCGDCTPSNGGVEICDGRDNDCDALIDEGVRNACNDCGAVPAELCNGADDDCDGDIDEGVRNACGACGPEPAEVCDEEDNDCDGQVDENTRNACNRCGADLEESCNNVDDDCDGRVDEGAQCPSALICVNGECAEPCQAGECFNGQVCVEGACVTPCNNADCPAGEVCQDGACADACRGIDCPADTACWLGACVEISCEVSGCPAGEVCVSGACVGDPCAQAGCDDDQGCRDGVCFDTCLGVTCPAGNLCIQGLCVRDNCAGRDCLPGQICERGECVEDPCQGVTCPPGQACDAGRCVDDLCLQTACPDGTRCLLGECVLIDQDNGQVMDDDPAPDSNNGDPGDNNGDPNNGVGGDEAPAGPVGPEACHCASVARPAPLGWWAAALALAALVLRRRMR
jgi:hypothetical protein